MLSLLSLSQGWCTGGGWWFVGFWVYHSKHLIPQPICFINNNNTHYKETFKTIALVQLVLIVLYNTWLVSEIQGCYGFLLIQCKTWKMNRICCQQGARTQLQLLQIFLMVGRVLTKWKHFPEDKMQNSSHINKKSSSLLPAMEMNPVPPGSASLCFEVYHP